MVSDKKAGAFPKRPRPNFKSLESSYDVFLKFVKRSEDLIDCSGMLSEDCYNLWLKTRIKAPSKPAESFRRALTAHCRGVDGRRPFPEDVETELLSELRKSRIWPCFEKTGVNIGSRGYKAVGYWEKKRKQHNIGTDEAKEEPEAEKDVENENLLIKGRDIKSKIVETEEKYDSCNVTVTDNNRFGKSADSGALNVASEFCSSSEPQEFGDDDGLIGELMNWASEKASKLYPPVNCDAEPSSASHEDSFGGQPISDVGIISTLNSLHTMPYVYPEHKNCHMAYDALLRFNQENSRMMIASMMRRLSKDQGLLSLSHMQLVEDLHEKTKQEVIFSKEFVKPAKEYCVFDPNKPIGVLTADTVQFVVIECCENAKKIYRGDITGFHSLQLRVESAHTFLHLNELLQEYVTAGEVWSRSLERRLDGTPMILLNRYIKSEIGDVNFCHVQDITDKFGYLIPASVLHQGKNLASRKRLHDLHRKC